MLVTFATALIPVNQTDDTKFSDAAAKPMDGRKLPAVATPEFVCVRSTKFVRSWFVPVGYTSTEMKYVAGSCTASSKVPADMI